jgi:hypothetical protein
MSFREVAAQPNGMKLFSQGISLGPVAYEGPMTINCAGNSGTPEFIVTQADAAVGVPATFRVMANSTRGATGSGLEVQTTTAGTVVMQAVDSSADCTIWVGAKGAGGVVLAPGTGGTSVSNQPLTGVKQVSGGDAAGISVTSTTGPIALTASAAAQDITLTAGAGAQIVHASPAVFAAAPVAGDTQPNQFSIGSSVLAAGAAAGNVTMVSATTSRVISSYLQCSLGGALVWIPVLTFNPTS